MTDSRMILARSLRELADNSSEVQLRNALSRSYYSILHAANALVGKVDHHIVVEELSKIDAKNGDAVETLQKLRAQADYDPDFVLREFGGDLELFRIEVRKRVEEGRTIFRWISSEIERKGGRANG